MGDERLGWGILGCGQFARRRILPAFAAARRARLVALQRRRPGDAEATAREFGVPKGYGARAELLADPAVQAVFVATPNACHLEDVLAAAGAGKHVLCEKPLGVNAEECRRMLAACRAAGVKLFVGHCFRYAQAVEIVRAHLVGGELGELRVLRGWYSFRNPATAWRTDVRISGGGPLLDLAPHLLDFLLYATSGTVTDVQALVEPAREWSAGRCEDYARAFLQFRKGFQGVVEVSFREHFRNGFEVVGSRSSLRGEYTLNQIQSEHVRLLHLRSDPEPPSVTELAMERREVYRLELEDISQALLDPTHVPCCATGEDGLRTLEIIDAIYESGQTGRRVPVGG